jgi:2-hydroxychromene-2-carboxylate isomerase
MDAEHKDELQRLAREAGLDPEAVLAALGADLDPEAAAALAALAGGLRGRAVEPED